jgi:hypothetical protein
MHPKRRPHLGLNARDPAGVHLGQGVVVLGCRLMLHPAHIGLFKKFTRLANVRVSLSLKQKKPHDMSPALDQ